MDIVGCDFVNPFNYIFRINPTEPMGDLISSSNKQSDADPLLKPGEPLNGCQNDFESINDTMTGANDSDQGHNRQRSNGVRDNSGEHARRDQTGWEKSFCCCSSPDYHSKEADNTTGNKSVPIQKQPISVISDQYNAMQKENGYHQSYSNELEAHKKELKGEGQAKCGEAGDKATQLKGGEETKATTSSNTLVTIEEIPTHILREQELQRQNDILRRKVAQLEKRELKLEEQLQDVITDVEQSRLRNVEKTTVTHSLASIEYPDKSMRTDQVASLQREIDALRGRLIDLEENKKELLKQLQEANDDGDEARKRLSLLCPGNVEKTTVTHSLASIEYPDESMRTDQVASLQRENDALRGRLIDLEENEKELLKQLQEANDDGDEARKRLSLLCPGNVEKTTVTHSLASIEYPDESMRTDQVASLQRENDALRGRLIDLEENEKELLKQLQEANDDGDEARKRLSLLCPGNVDNTTVEQSLETKEHSHESKVTEQAVHLQRENDAQRKRLVELEAIENDLLKQLQQAYDEADESRISNVEKTTVTHSLASIEYPDESMRTDQFARLQRENDALRRRLIDSEANEKELLKQLQEANDDGDEARKRLSLLCPGNVNNTTVEQSLETKEHPFESKVTEQAVHLQRENDAQRKRLVELEAIENDLLKQLQQAYDEADESRISNVDKTKVKHSSLAIEDPDESMRTDQFARLQRENDALRRRLIDSEKALHKQLQKANADGDEARTRLSEMMSNRLTDNNPNIADIGDKYRPTKLAELMSELYDNQWTEAFDYFEETWQGKFSELACLDFLLNVIMEVYTFCSRKVSEEWTAAIKSFSLSTEKDRELLKQLKDKRKAIALETYPRILKSCLETFKHLPLSNDPGFDITLEAKAVRKYLQECVRLCWLMVVQDPPVYLYCYGWESSQPGPWLVYSREQVKAHYEGQENGNATLNEHQGDMDCPDDTNEGTNCDGQVNGIAAHNVHQDLIDGPDGINDRDDKPETRDDGGTVLKTHESGIRNRVLFNKDQYREYTKRGAYLKYVVWPIVFLFEGGSVLQKGVAQGGD